MTKDLELKMCDIFRISAHCTVCGYSLEVHYLGALTNIRNLCLRHFLLCRKIAHELMLSVKNNKRR